MICVQQLLAGRAVSIIEIEMHADSRFVCLHMHNSTDGGCFFTSALSSSEAREQVPRFATAAF